LRIVGVSFVPLANPVPRYRYSAAWSRKNKHPGVPRIVAIAQQIARQRAGKKN
jgi:hypothetical protein